MAFDWKSLQRHPLSAEYENITGEPWQDFLGNLRSVGIVNNRKIVVYQGQVLDGWQLYRGCLALNIEPQFREFPPGQDPEQYVIIANDLRRKEESAESVQQRAANRRARVVAARANGQSARAIAAAENVSHTTVLNDIAAISESPSGGNPFQLETEQQQQVTSDGNHYLNAVDANGCLLPVPENGKIVGQDGKQYPAVKPTTVVRCVSCERRARKGQELPEKCPDCKLLRGPAKKATKPSANPDADECPAGDKLPAGAPMVDMVGTQVPKNLRDIFASDVAAKSIRLLQEVRRNVLNLNKWDKYLRGFEMAATLEAVVEDLKTSTPFAVHKECDGKGCEDCRNEGWVPEWRWNELKATVPA